MSGQKQTMTVRVSWVQLKTVKPKEGPYTLSVNPEITTS